MINTIPPSSQQGHKDIATTHVKTLTISVVIAWVNPLEFLLPGLESLRRQSRCADEIIVVTRHGEDAQGQLRQLYPEIVLCATVPDTPITTLRSMGIKLARGTVVAVTEDHCVPARDWIATIERWMVHCECQVVGGPVENATTTRLRDWAAFLTEYASAIRSAEDEPHHTLTDNNVAYRRTLTEGLCVTLDRGLWESFYHQTLTEHDVYMQYDPQMVVYHRRSFDFLYFLAQRFQFSRSFAAMRLQSLTFFGRVKYGIGSLLLPPMLFLRGLMILWRKKRFVRQYLICSPLIGTYVTVGALGEMIGYFFGGGNSLEKIE